MDVVHSLTYLDPRNPRFLNYSAAQSYPGVGMSFVSEDPSMMWSDPTMSDISVEFGRQFDFNQSAKFVDPRAVADPTLPIKHKSPQRSPMSIDTLGLASASRPISPASSDTQSPHESHADSHQFSFNASAFRASPMQMESHFFNPAADLYQRNTSSERTVTPPSTTINNATNACNAVEKQLTPPPSPPVRRRGPGRPSKAQSSAQYLNNKRPTGHSAVKLRRQMHNDSAMRSRARLNNTLEELWNIIPKNERTVQPDMQEGDLDDNREVCRAVKVEIAIAYLKKLQAIARNSQNDISLL